jgi:hypothetical protein
MMRRNWCSATSMPAAVLAHRLLDAGIELDPPQNLPGARRLPAHELARAADALRRSWRLPAGRIDDLTGVIEGAVGIVLYIDFGDDDATAFITTPGDERLWFLCVQTPRWLGGWSDRNHEPSVPSEPLAHDLRFPEWRRQAGLTRLLVRPVPACISSVSCLAAPSRFSKQSGAPPLLPLSRERSGRWPRAPSVGTRRSPMAPMSTGDGRWELAGVAEEVIDASDEVAFEAANRFPVALAVAALLGEVVHRSGSWRILVRASM